MSILTGFLYLALNVYHEARSEEQLDQVAVAHVTLNRAEKRHLSVKEVVLQPHQFSWTDQLDSYMPQDMVAFVECARSAFIALQGHDFTGGATYYHHRRISPYWAAEYAYVGEYGVHRFYREEK